MTNRVEVKLTVAKLIEFAYSKDKEITTKIVRSKGGFKIAIDEEGNATLSGSAGRVAFKSDGATNQIGAKIKKATVLFSNGKGGNINYTASFSFSGAASITVSGSFDLEKIILSCSGLLCKAARAVNGRHQAYENQLKNIMGY